MGRWLFGWAVLAVFLPAQGLAQSHSGFPVDIVAGPMPQPVMADGRAHLLYELHLTNVDIGQNPSFSLNAITVGL